MADDDEKMVFLYEAVKDTQSTIRALDVKAGFIFVVIVQPLLNVKHVSEFYNSSVLSGGIIFKVMCLITVLFWILSLFLLFRTIMPISNPAKNVSGNEKQFDCFYLAGLFNFTRLDIFFNCNVLSRETPEQYLSRLNDLDVKTILAIEKLKLSYIRDIKSIRVNNCIKNVFLWILLGFLVYIMG